MMKFSVCTVSLPTLPLERAAGAVAEAGFAGIEWRVEPRVGSIPDAVPAHPYLADNAATLRLSVADARRARHAAHAAGIVSVGLGAYVEPGDHETLELVFDMAVESDTPQVRVQTPRLSRTGRRYSELFEEARVFLAAVEKRATTRGIQVLVEIHHNTISPSASLTHRLVGDLDPAAVGVIYDIGNMVFEGYEDHRIGLEVLGAHVRHVHFKNAVHVKHPERGWRPAFAPLDDGLIDIPHVLGLIRASGYQGWYSLEDLSLNRDPVETMNYNAAALRKWGLL